MDKEISRSAAVERVKQAFEVPEAASSGCVAQALVLRERINEPVTDVIAMLEEQPSSGLAALQNLANRRVGRERRVSQQEAPWARR